LIIFVFYSIFIAVQTPQGGTILERTITRSPYSSAKTTVSAANFADLANGPDFPFVEWRTMLYFGDVRRLSAYGHAGTIDHHLIVTQLDSEDEKRVVEVLSALHVVDEEAIRQELRTKRFCHFFVQSF
jgi:hypothetical protein